MEEAERKLNRCTPGPFLRSCGLCLVFPSLGLSFPQPFSLLHVQHPGVFTVCGEFRRYSYFIFLEVEVLAWLYAISFLI